MVQGLKYRDQTDFAPTMAQWMLRAGCELVHDADLIVPVPLHRSRFFWRRFNQSAELAREIAKPAQKSFAPHVLTRIKNTRQQVGLKLAERQENVRTAFSQRRIEIEGRRILLVDDVYTTGATVYAATKALIKGGAAAVDVLTFARVLPGDFQHEEPETI